MSIIKSIPNESKFNSIAEGKNTSVGFNHQKYGQQHSAKKVAQAIVQKKMEQANSHKKNKNNVDEGGVPIMMALSANVQNIRSGSNIALFAQMTPANDQPTEFLMKTAATESPPISKDEEVIPLVNIMAIPLTTNQIFPLKLGANIPTYGHKTNSTLLIEQSWLATSLNQQTTFMDSSSPKSFENKKLSAITGPYLAGSENKASTQNNITQAKDALAIADKPQPSDAPQMQHFPDAKSFQLEQSEIIQPDQIDITKNIVAQVMAESSVRAPVTTPTPSTQSSADKAVQLAELMASGMSNDNHETVPARTLSYTFSHWKNTPSVSFTLANREEVVASTYSYEVQQALRDSQHLFHGEQKVVIRREEHEGQQRHQQQQQQNDEE
ncbi:hypothetical protein [Providencia rustigianii]|uniref:SpaN/EivJ family type III secretion system needle length determinant n=1 Tax=Providencia rustigianii TaxID=158850 RepID=UPI000D8FD61A|nr:hypothetical protein [Providencia rustigianii]SPY76080.1 Uncharacterised protein [Providencia rustigianii]